MSDLATLALGTTPMHRADARIKLGLTGLCCAALATAPRTGPLGALALAAPGLLGLVVARVPLGVLARALLVAGPFAALLVLPAPFLEPGEVVAEVRLFGVGLKVTRDGLLLAATLVTKLLGALATTLTLVASTPFPRLVDALGRLGLPAAFVVIVALTYRYLAVLAEEARRMLRARRARAAGGRPGLHTAAGLVGTLLVRSLERAERVHRAMVARGFSGALPSSAPPRLRPSDLALLLATAATVAGLWWLARTGRCA